MKALTRQVLQQLVDAVDDGLAVIDASHGDWPIQWFNDAFAAITARAAGALANQSGRELVQRLGGSVAVAHLNDAIAAGEKLKRTLKSPEPEQRRTTLVLRAEPLLEKNKTRSGRYLLLLRPRDAEEQRSETAELRNELAAAKEQITAMSDDPVTGLASERRFRAQLARDWAVAQRESYPLSLIGLSMDAYPAYLSTFGEHASDSCMRMLARTVKRRLRRGSDFAGFFAPSSIVVLIDGGDADAVRRFADRIADDIKALHIHHPHSPVAKHVTVSVGVATQVPGADDQPDVFLDSAMPEPVEEAPVDEFSRLTEG
ncbi:MAG: diguanylate cyclase [Pseudomonadota bacterium]